MILDHLKEVTKDFATKVNILIDLETVAMSTAPYVNPGPRSLRQPSLVPITSRNLRAHHV